MKNTLKILGIIAIVAVIGFSMVSCSDDDAGSSLNGTWEGKDEATGKAVSVIIDGDSITFKFDGKEYTGKLKDPTAPTGNIPPGATVEGKDIFDGSDKVGFVQYVEYQSMWSFYAYYEKGDVYISLSGGENGGDAKKK